MINGLWLPADQILAEAKSRMSEPEWLALRVQLEIRDATNNSTYALNRIAVALESPNLGTERAAVSHSFRAVNTKPRG